MVYSTSPKTQNKPWNELPCWVCCQSPLERSLQRSPGDTEVTSKCEICQVETCYSRVSCPPEHQCHLPLMSRCHQATPTGLLNVTVLSGVKSKAAQRSKGADTVTQHQAPTQRFASTSQQPPPLKPTTQIRRSRGLRTGKKAEVHQQILKAGESSGTERDQLQQEQQEPKSCSRCLSCSSAPLRHGRSIPQGPAATAQLPAQTNEILTQFPPDIHTTGTGQTDPAHLPASHCPISQSLRH